MIFSQVLFAVFVSLAAAVPHVVYVKHTVTVTNPVVVTVMVPAEQQPEQPLYAVSSEPAVIDLKRF
jgi:hypothetical protein